MKVYFTASEEGKSQYKEEHRLIVEMLKNLGAQVFNAIEITAESESASENNKMYKKRAAALKKADFVVAEISYPSVSVGYEISNALTIAKPVLALRTKGTRVNILESHPDEKFKLIEYEKGNLKSVLEKWIESASDLVDVRFNFFVSPKIVGYLNWLSKKRRIPRSVYLRGLIEKEMAADQEFQEEMDAAK
jgi:hypothetical protein